MHDPLGLGVLLRGEVYSTPNRFFAHWTISTYFKNFPLFLQNFVEPIESIYLSAAIAKILIQFVIIYLLAVYITNRRCLLNIDFLIAATLIYPLFQTSGYNRYMGIIDQSVIYAMFYALSLGLLLLFFLPAFRDLYHNTKPGNRIVISIFQGVLALVLSLNAAIIPGVILIVCPMIILILVIRNYKHSDLPPGFYRVLNAIRSIPGHILVSFILISLFCMYSFYIAGGDSMSMDQSVPIAERYSRLLLGFYYIITSKIGFPLLILCIILNILIILKYHRSGESGKMISLIKWIGIFAVIYIMLLPLGGYRIYSENIIRYDTFMPVTIGIMFAFGTSTFFLIKNMKGRMRIIYISWIAIILLIFTNSDRLEMEGYKCERDALETISSSDERIVELEHDCFIIDWRVLSDPNRRELDADLLYLWNITDEKRLFYQKPVK